MKSHTKPSDGHSAGPADQSTRTIQPTGLAALSRTPLTPKRQSFLDRAMSDAGGSPTWVARKRAEARDLLALERLAPPGRYVVHELHAEEALRLVVHLDVPVACRPIPEGPLMVERGALLGIRYPEEVLLRPLPGFAFVQVLFPQYIWHANVNYGSPQTLCLGASLPVGIRAKELVLMSYGALAMQALQIDGGDAAGVLNGVAAEWWQANLDRVPLTSVPFLLPESGDAS